MPNEYSITFGIFIRISVQAAECIIFFKFIEIAWLNFNLYLKKNPCKKLIKKIFKFGEVLLKEQYHQKYICVTSAYVWRPQS
jgi:hypothetical protein